MKKHCVAAAVALALTLGGCASTNPKDPFEPYNRAAFTFNEKVDQYALKPAAQAYNYLPEFVRTAVGNFFGNIGDVWTAFNEFLQGKGEAGVSDVMRVAVNTTFGLAGLIDWGTEVRLYKHKEDFGQTLGTWGVKSGPYLVLPLLGPSTLRDTAALPADLWIGDIWSYRSPVYQRNIGYGLRVLDTRASLLNASTLLEDAALDRYAFMRDGYLQRRESLIHDGETSEPSYDDDESTKDEKQ